jgi:hypothetical protein
MKAMPFARDLLAASALAFLFCAAVHADTLRCGSRVVNMGDRDIAVRDRCGDPYFTEQSYALDIRGANSPLEVQDEIVYDVWYYNFGPRQLMQRMLFRDGRLARMEALGYGVNAIGQDCNLDTMRSGTPAGEVMAHCGEPISRNATNRSVVRRDGNGHERFTQLRHEEWIYDLGDGRLLRVLSIDNGRLTDVSSERR